jgi:hypothetical protein
MIIIICNMLGVQEMGRMMEIFVKDTYFFINMEFGHHLPVIQLVSFLEETQVSSEQSLVQYCATLHGKHLLVA